MTPIIAGRFDQQAQAGAAIEALRRQGFDAEDVSTFFLNPPGQHSAYALGGDRDESPGATDAQNGAVKGAAVGGALGLGLGLATAPFVGAIGPLAGAGAGAYAGSLVGALGDMKGPQDTVAASAPHAEHEPMPERRVESTPPQRQSGIMVAARAAEYAKRIVAVNVLRSTGAHDIERAEGTWQSGKWADFDPLKAPRLIDPPTQAIYPK
jgi:hypothetical protein